jgi:hypothetical protein
MSTKTDPKEEARMALAEKRRQDGVIPELRAKIFDRVAHSSTLLLAFGERNGNDGRLADLTVGIGQIASSLWSLAALEDRLVRVAAFCVGWLKSMDVENPFVFIHEERLRQANLYVTEPEKYLVRMDSHVADNRRKLRVLVEELGEVAATIDLIEQATPSGYVKLRTENLKSELVQVAAVCVAWLETRQDAGAHSALPAGRGKGVTI